MKKLALIALLALVPAGLSAARLVLRDGSVVNGSFVSGSSQEIVFQDDNGVRRRFALDRIQTIDFDQINSSQAGNRNSPFNNNTANRTDVRNNGPQWATLPSGTEISVRTDQEISSQTATEGRTYPASIQRDVNGPDGNVLIPKGSQANLVIRSVNEGGTLSSGSLVLDLDSVVVNGRRYVVSTSDLQQSDSKGIGKNKRTAEMVGGGAVLGTVLGAIAGGGKGAAIGAIAGTAAGGGVQVLTKGKEIRVPAETTLTFRLDQNLQLNEAR
jgi:hypothetical protein